MKALSSALCVLVLAACGGQSGNTLKIGALLSTTGDLANVGTEQLEAVTLAIEEINGRGGVLGKQLELVHRDDGTETTGASSGATALANAGATVIIGATGSGVSLAAFGALKGKNVVQIATSATSPALTTEVDDGYLFRTCSSDALQGKLLAARARAAGHSDVAIIHIPDAYGSGLAAAFTSAFTTAGGTVTLTREYVIGEPSFTTLVGDVMATNPDAVLLVAYPEDGAQIVSDFKAGYPSSGTTWYFTDGLEDTAFITAAGADKFATLTHEGSGPGTAQSPRLAAYRDAFSARYSKSAGSGTFSANAYDAVYLAALAMEAAKDSSGTAVRDHLTAVSSGGTAYAASEYEAAVTALKAGEDINFEGASGAVDLSPEGDAPAPYDIWKVQGGSITIIEQSVNP